MRTVFRFPRCFAATFLALVCLAWPAAAQVLDWPQEIAAPEGTIVVYQPQFETVKGDQVTGRAAMSITPKGKTEPIFGAFWFSGRIETDKAADIVTLGDVHVTRARWPNVTEEQERRFTEIVEASAPKAGMNFSYESFSAGLATAERERSSMPDLKNDPPRIVFSTDLAVLLLFDGEPQFSKVENSPFERALNTPLLVVRDTRSKTSYLSSGKLWYSAKDPLGTWQPNAQPPADLVQMLPKDESTDPAPAVPPRIVVATEPTELVCTDGQPSWKPVGQGELLYAENTETPWVRDLSSQQMYVLLSGRWYRSTSTNGPWTFARPDQLPEAFKKIPSGSDIGGVRTSVAGTQEADDAMLDAQVPQTTAIKRSEAKFEAQYAGDAKFQSIPGTKVSYATNTGDQILQINGKYYAVDNGVWFVADSPKGPWAVADSVPEQEIQQIPPSAPVYNVTHVHVYQSTPEVVYVGYTPGYMWSFPYYGVPVYGTGYYYPPYIGPGYYYPRPPTWGFHVGYNPWSGWNFGVSWSSGFFSVGASWGGGWGGGYYRPWGCCGGWYGGGYRRPVYVNTGNINIGNRVSVGNRWNNNYARNYRGNASDLRRNNIYQDGNNRLRNADRATVQRDINRAKVNRANRPNNVYADRDGNIARKTKDGWQQRGKTGWEKPEPADIRQKVDSADLKRPAGGNVNAAQAKQKVDSADLNRARPGAGQVNRDQARQRVDSADLNRYSSARDRGRQREMSRPTPTQSRARSAPASRPQSRPTGARKR